MSAKNSRSDIIVLSVLGFVTVVTLLWLAGAGQLVRDESWESWVPSTYSRNVKGTRVIYTLLDRLSVPVERLEQPWCEDELSDLQVLFVLDPAVTVHGGERAVLSQWVWQGGVNLQRLGWARFMVLGIPVDHVTSRGVRMPSCQRVQLTRTMTLMMMTARTVLLARWSWQTTSAVSGSVHRIHWI